MNGAYNLLIGLHIIAVIAWMAGLITCRGSSPTTPRPRRRAASSTPTSWRWEGKLIADHHATRR